MFSEERCKNIELEEEKCLVKGENRSNAKIVEYLGQENIRLRAKIRHLRLQIRGEKDD